MFHLDPAAGNFMVIGLLFFGQWLFFTVLIWKCAVAMVLSDALIARICLRMDRRVDMHLAFFEYPEVVLAAPGNTYAYDLAVLSHC
jgi:hypothetical protein